MPFQKITIIGVGLLGGSIGLAVKRKKLARKVVGFVRRASNVSECKKFHAVDLATTDLRLAVEKADLVILCTPLAQMAAITKQFLPALMHGAIVTDVGSVKAGVVHELESLVKKSGAHFIGGHPMAGAEKTGVAAARANLFENAVCVLTPTKKSNPKAVRKLEQFWKSLGARVLKLDAAQHDLLVSRSSHLPHVVAATLANLVLNPTSPKQQAALCANGFRDTTRIASGSPEMWRDIALANRKNISRSLDTFISDLQKFQRVLKKSDAKAVSKIFARAKLRRNNWCVSSASTSSE